MPPLMALIHVSFFQKVVSDPQLEGVHDDLRLEKRQNKIAFIHPRNWVCQGPSTWGPSETVSGRSGILRHLHVTSCGPKPSTGKTKHIPKQPHRSCNHHHQQLAPEKRGHLTGDVYFDKFWMTMAGKCTQPFLHFPTTCFT